MVMLLTQNWSGSSAYRYRVVESQPAPPDAGFSLVGHAAAEPNQAYL